MNNMDYIKRCDEDYKKCQAKLARETITKYDWDYQRAYDALDKSTNGLAAYHIECIAVVLGGQVERN